MDTHVSWIQTHLDTIEFDIFVDNNSDIFSDNLLENIATWEDNFHKSLICEIWTFDVNE